MGKLTVEQLEVEGKAILVRVDFNVPLNDGHVGDDTRIRAALPTIRHLIQRGAKVVLASHLGRPKGEANPKYTLRPVATRLQELLGSPVAFSPDVVGDAAKSAVEAMSPGDVLLLENVRYHAGEEANDPEFAKALANLADGFVSDAFGTVHRAHASTAGVAALFPQAACGFLIAKELEFLGQALFQPQSPYVAIVGGAKVGDKIAVINSLLERADKLLIGGAMAYTFLKALGHTVGTSLLDEPNLELAGKLIEQSKAQGKEIMLPVDHLIADKPAPDAIAETCNIDIPDGKMALDIGPNTVRNYQAALSGAKMIVWNGPMGMFEMPPFQKGTFAIAYAVADSNAVSIVGGGDSVAAANQAGVSDRISHISTGGGASLEFLEGKQLPGIVALTEV